MTRILKQLECTPLESVICAVSLLQKEAYTWWEIVTQHVLIKAVDWKFFQVEFQKKHVGELYLEERKQEYLMLKQGDMSIVDYE